MKKPPEPKGKVPPPLPGNASPPKRAMSLDRIEVDSKWLIPPVEKKWRKVRDVPLEPLPLPSSLAVKPRGKLPPPLPREDDAERPSASLRRAPKSEGRISKRPPSTRK